MRPFNLLILLLLGFNQSFAQKKTYLNLDAALLYDFNDVDVSRNTGSFLMKSDNTIGYELGLSFNIDKGKIRWKSGAGFHLNSKNISFYDNDEMHSSVLHSEDFTNYGFYLKTRVAYSLFENSSSSLNFGLGAQLLWTFNNRPLDYVAHYESYLDEPTNKYYDYLKYFYSYRFGRQKSSFSIFPDINLLTGLEYKTSSVFKNRDVTLGLEWRINVLFPSEQRRSFGKAMMYNQSGSLLAEEAYEDRSHRLALILGISL